MLQQVSLSLGMPVDQATIQRQDSFHSALNLCIDVAGLSDKSIYIDLEIDKGHWSKIMNGTASIPWMKLEKLMDICGNDIPLQWLAWRRGKGLHTLESEQQRIIREKDEAIARKDIEIEALRSAIRGA